MGGVGWVWFRVWDVQVGVSFLHDKPHVRGKRFFPLTWGLSWRKDRVKTVFLLFSSCFFETLVFFFGKRKKNSLAWGRSVEERGERGENWDQKKKINFFHPHVWYVR